MHRALLSFVMVGFSFDNGAGTIDLLGTGEADHLVGKRHFRKRYLIVGSCIDILRESVRTTYDKKESPGRIAFLFQPTGKVYAAIFRAVFIEKNDSV